MLISGSWPTAAQIQPEAIFSFLFLAVLWCWRRARRPEEATWRDLSSQGDDGSSCLKRLSGDIGDFSHVERRDGQATSPFINLFSVVVFYKVMNFSNSNEIWFWFSSICPSQIDHFKDLKCPLYWFVTPIRQTLQSLDCWTRSGWSDVRLNVLKLNCRRDVLDGSPTLTKTWKWCVQDQFHWAPVVSRVLITWRYCKNKLYGN